MSKNIKARKHKNVDQVFGTSRIFDGDTFHGTAPIYAATEDDHMWFVSDFEVNSLRESRLEQTRARRQELNEKSRKVPKIKKDQLSNELLIIFGPDMSATSAVKALERVKKSILKGGLLIGRRRSDDEYMVETVGPNPKIEVG